MGILEKLFQPEEKTTELIPTTIATLSNLQGSIEQPSKADLDYALQNLFEDEEQVLTYTLAHAINTVRLLQASYSHKKFTIQIGIEKNNRTHYLQRKVATFEECVEIFYDFFEHQTIKNIEQYQPVTI